MLWTEISTHGEPTIMSSARPRTWTLASKLLLFFLWCAAARCEPMQADFNEAIERCIAYFPMLAGQTHLTMDMNRDAVNWTQDAAELYLIHVVLGNPDLPHHAEVLEAWKHNRTQIAEDLGCAGSKEDAALGDYLAGMATSNSRNTGPIERALTYVGVFGGPNDLLFSKDKYVHLDAILAFNADPRLPGDFDGDGVPNDREYWAARRYAEKKHPQISNYGHLDTPFWEDDLDGDGLCVFFDSDSDGDGLTDGYESDVDGDGILDYLSPETDTWHTPLPSAGDDVFVNPDGDEYDNMLDADSDDDGILDAVEGTVDSDGDGIPDFLDAADGPNPPRADVVTPVTLDVNLKKDVVYATKDGISLMLDIAWPLGSAGPHPLIVCIHGGGWQFGDKSSYTDTITEFARHGYGAASIDYRLAPEHKFPAQIEDTRDALRYLQAHASEYEIDPHNVGALGDSAGGYLAVMLGLLDPEDGLEGADGSPEHPSKVQAVVNYYGGFDFRTWRLSPEANSIIEGDFGKPFEEVIADYLGTSDRNAAVMAQASPATYADGNDPPILTFHGTLDLHVPVEEARQLHAALLAAGTRSQLEIIDGAAHGWGGPIMERTTRMTLDFFDRELKPGSAGSRQAQAALDVYSERPSSIPIKEDIVYAEANGMQLHLDLARPHDGEGPFPLILGFHGGTYEQNARKALHRDLQDFAEHGYVAASIEYRGLLKGVFPEPVHDGKAALRFLLAHAEEYDIDSGKLAVWGGSMGGWLALMVGLTGPENGFDVGENLEYAGKVRVVLERYGLTDLKKMVKGELSPEQRESVAAFFGGQDVAPATLEKASPITYVDAEDPPVLILHNPADKVVPIAQSEMLRGALERAGVASRMELLTGPWHASEFTEKSVTDLADRARCRDLELDFLARHLEENE